MPKESPMNNDEIRRFVTDLVKRNIGGSQSNVLPRNTMDARGRYIIDIGDGEKISQKQTQVVQAAAAAKEETIGTPTGSFIKDKCIIMPDGSIQFMMSDPDNKDFYAYQIDKQEEQDNYDQDGRLTLIPVDGDYPYATTWVAAKTYNYGKVIIPNDPNGAFYVCTVGGTSGGTEPTWGTPSEGATVADNTVEWTTHLMSTGHANLTIGSAATLQQSRYVKIGESMFVSVYRPSGYWNSSWGPNPIQTDSAEDLILVHNGERFKCLRRNSYGLRYTIKSISWGMLYAGSIYYWLPTEIQIETPLLEDPSECGFAILSDAGFSDSPKPAFRITDVRDGVTTIKPIDEAVSTTNHTEQNFTGIQPTPTYIQPTKGYAHYARGTRQAEVYSTTDYALVNMNGAFALLRAVRYAREGESSNYARLYLQQIPHDGNGISSFTRVTLESFENSDLDANIAIYDATSGGGSFSAITRVAYGAPTTYHYHSMYGCFKAHTFYSGAAELCTNKPTTWIGKIASGYDYLQCGYFAYIDAGNIYIKYQLPNQAPTTYDTLTPTDLYDNGYLCGCGTDSDHGSYLIFSSTSAKPCDSIYRLNPAAGLPAVLYDFSSTYDTVVGSPMTKAFMAGAKPSMAGDWMVAFPFWVYSSANALPYYLGVLRYNIEDSLLYLDRYDTGYNDATAPGESFTCQSETIEDGIEIYTQLRGGSGRRLYVVRVNEDRAKTKELVTHSTCCQIFTGKAYRQTDEFVLTSINRANVKTISDRIKYRDIIENTKEGTAQEQPPVKTINGIMPNSAGNFTVKASADGIEIVNTQSDNSIDIKPDDDLEALEALSTTGFPARTAVNTWSLRSLANASAGLTWTNPAGVAGNPTPVFANDLGALEGLSTTGIACRTTTDTWALRTLAAPAAGITVTNPGGVAGNITLALADDLAAVEGLSGTGIAVRTGASTWTNRTITGTADQVNVSNGDGVSGNPTLSLPQSIATTSSPTFAGLTVTGLTAGRVVLVGTSDVLADSANLLFDAATSTFTIGTDVTLYRSAANVLKTDDTAWIVGTLGVGAEPLSYIGIRSTLSLTDPSSNPSTLNLGGTITMTDDISRSGYGIQGALVHAGASGKTTTGTWAGIYGQMSTTTNGTVATCVGVKCDVTVGASTTVNYVLGCHPTLTLTGTVGNLAAAFYSTLASATKVYNFYISGTAPGYFNHEMRIGTTTACDANYYMRIAGGIEPNADDTSKLGTTALRWAEGHFSDFVSMREDVRLYWDSEFKGVAVKILSGAAVAKYDIVQLSTSADDRAIQAAADCDMPIGVATNTTAGADETLWVMVYGIATVDFKTGVTPTRGYIAYCSSEAGKADNSATIPAVALHNREIGHVMNTGSAAGTARVLLHYN